MHEKCFAETSAAKFRSHEEILEIDPVFALPGRIVEEPERHADDSRSSVVIDFDEIAEDTWLFGEESGDEIGFARLDRIRCSFVIRQLLDEAEYFGGVTLVRSANSQRSTSQSQRVEPA
jgi:hypothetical protein